MAFCAKCGAQVPDGTAFCPVCGAPVSAAAPQPQQPQQAYPQQPVMPVPVQAYDPFDHTAEFDPKDISDNKVIAMSVYLMGFIGIIIALLASKESKYAYFHVRQSMKLQMTTILAALCCVVPFLGWIVFGVWSLICFVLEIIAFFGVAGGKAKEVPIVRSFGFFK